MANNGFVNLRTIAEYGGFQSRVSYALVVAAVNVMAESAGTVNHAERVIYAKKIINGDYDLIDPSMAVLTNSTIAAESDSTIVSNGSFNIPDGDIQFAINSLFNALAGVST